MVVFICLLMDVSLFAQSTNLAELNNLLISVQSYVNSNRIDLGNTLIIKHANEAVSFAPDIDSLLMKQLNELKNSGSLFKDSTVYEIAIFSVPEADSVILSLRDSWKIRIYEDAFFPSIGGYGEFQGGMRKMNSSIAQYFSQNKELFVDSLYHFSVILDNQFNSRLLYILADTKVREDSINSFWHEYNIKHLPASLYKKLWASIYQFEVQIDTDSTVNVQCIMSNIVAGLGVAEGELYILQESKSRDSFFTIVFDNKNSVAKIMADNHIMENLSASDGLGIKMALKNMVDQKEKFPSGAYYISKYKI